MYVFNIYLFTAKNWNCLLKIRFLHFATQNPKAGKIRTESGVWIPATYKTNRYNLWKEKTKIEEANEDDSEEETPQMKKRELI